MLKKESFKNRIDKILNYKSIWISDLHLGTRGCQSELLLEFIKYTQSEKLYLVGDIVDGWALKNTWYWPQSHNDVVQKILKKARSWTLGWDATGLGSPCYGLAFPSFSGKRVPLARPYGAGRGFRRVYFE